jgi:hypothetical protein
LERVLLAEPVLAGCDLVDLSHCEIDVPGTLADDVAPVPVPHELEPRVRRLTRLQDELRIELTSRYLSDAAHVGRLGNRVPVSRLVDRNRSGANVTKDERASGLVVETYGR